MNLPHDIYVTQKNCGAPDSFYDSFEHEIVVCNEMLQEFHNLFARETKSLSKVNRSVVGATTFFFFHEVGHALIRVWDLPITGREEDAADQFASVLLLDHAKQGPHMVLDGANIFRLCARWYRPVRNRRVYWAAHSLDEQRYYDTLCLVYGNEPERFEYLVNNGTLPLERASECEDEFYRVRSAWTKLLAPFLTEPVGHPFAALRNPLNPTQNRSAFPSARRNSPVSQN
jgi:hypothetical protein